MRKLAILSVLGLLALGALLPATASGGDLSDIPAGPVNCQENEFFFGPLFDPIKNEGNHPNRWGDVPELTKTFGPLQPDGSRAVQIEFTAPGGNVNISGIMDAGGRITASGNGAFSGFPTTIQYEGRVEHNPFDPDFPLYGEFGRWTVGGEGNLPPGNGQGKPIVYDEACYFFPPPAPPAVDADGDGTPETTTTNTTVPAAISAQSTDASAVLNTSEGPQTIDLGDPINIAYTGALDTQIWAQNAGNGHQNVFATKRSGRPDDLNISLPNALGGGQIQSPGVINVTDALQKNTETTLDFAQVLTQGSSFDVNGSPTGDWSLWEDPSQTPQINSYNPQTGEVILGIDLLFTAPNLAGVGGIGMTAQASAQETAPLHFEATITLTVPDVDDLLADADNCPAVANPDQADTDGDGVGDACESLLVQGDVDCSGAPPDLSDAIRVSQKIAGLPVAQMEPCPDLAEVIGFTGANIWGDVGCNGDLDLTDAIKLQQFVASLPVTQMEPCFDIGAVIT